MEKINQDWARDVPCRNITIHGYCKYEGKGCSFKHDTTKSSLPSVENTEPLATNLKDLTLGTQSATPPGLGSTSNLPSAASTIPPSEVVKKKFNAASASVFTPGSAFSDSIPPLGKPVSTNKFANSPKLQDIPSFVPSASFSDNIDSAPTPAPKQFSIDSPVFQPSSAAVSNLHSPILGHSQFLANDEQINTPPINPYAQQSEPINPYSAIPAPQDFLYQQSTYPLQYHLYAPAPPPHLQIPLKGNEQNAESLFIPNKLRESLLHKNEATVKRLGQSNLPDIVGVYFDLVPLDNSLEKSDRTYGYTSSIYKAFSNQNGRAYALRRIEGVKIAKDRSISSINNWIKFRNSNVSQVVDAFTSRAFGDNSLIVVYDYYPTAKSIFEQHFTSLLGKTEPITPEIIWNYLIQISAGIAASHARNLPVRSISLQKVIVTSKNRVRISDIGVFDILDYDDENPVKSTKVLLLEDLTKLGHLILTLASAKLSATHRSLSPLDLVKHLDVDDELKEALNYLLSDDPTRTISGLQQLIAPKLYKALDTIEQSADYYEAQLTREIENARLVRLLTKLNFVLDRSELDNGHQWLPTGDRYPIKLFHQYVFNQVDEKGKPVLDLSHVLRALNKLDAGVDEKILLVSPDEQSCLIVTFKEIKDLVERSFHELTKD